MNKKLSAAMAASASVLAMNFVAEAAAYNAQAAVRGENVKLKWNIPAQPLSDALIAWSEQSNYAVLIRDDLAAGVQSQALTGSYTSFEALERLLSPSTLTYKIRNDTTLVVTPRLQAASLTVVGDSSVSRSASAAGVSYRARTGVASGGNVQAAGFESPDEEKDEVVVTGTRIRGAAPTAPVRVVTRDDIDQSGFGQLGDVVRSFPEVFAGGQNPGVVASTGSAGNQNVSNASTVNLRGIGTDATLTLLNGRRLAGDTFFQAADISGIPLAAVERVEIVADGSSALYGADAVAGVVNFILREDFDGAEVSGRVGGATQGGAFEQTYSALGGVTRSRWRAMANYEYSKQNGLTAGERNTTSEAVSETHLLRPQERHSVFLNAAGDLTDRLSLSVDALASKRNVNYLSQRFEFSEPISISIDTPSFSVGTTLDWKASNSWRIAVMGVLSGGHNEEWDRSPTTTSNIHYENGLSYAEFLAEGAVRGLPSGDIRTAFGGGWRQESFELSSMTSPQSDISGERDIRYVFGEALIPLVPDSEDRIGLRSLEISASGRFEDRSDFGSAATPKVGLRYEPVSGLTLRATWGKSFKAPSFQQLLQNRTAVLFPASAFRVTGGGAAFFVTGGNPDLGPERSRSWTVGGDFSLDGRAPLTLSATYFNIDLTDRVVIPVSPSSAALINPIFESFVDRDPTAQEQADLLANVSRFVNLSGAPHDPDTVIAIVRNLQQNALSQRIEGVDVSYRQELGAVSAFANATWIDLRQQSVPAAPEVTLSGTIANVPDIRARGGLTWEKSGLAVTGIVNFVSSSTDTGVTPNANIDSWTTVDANLSYEFDSNAGALSDMRIALSATNLFDRDPPFAFSPSLLQQGIFFDSTTASPIGRLISVTVRKRF